jgi:hypothetical protein
MKNTAMRRGLSILTLLILLWSGTAFAFETEKVTDVDFGTYGQQAYAYLQYIDQHFPDRDCEDGRDTLKAQEWIVAELTSAGYSSDQIAVEDFDFENEDGDVSAAQNIVVTLPGQTDRQIIVGAHYDGTGAGDNGSGTALLMETACDLIREPALTHTVVFIFFSAEENDGDGSAAYADAMTDEKIANTEYMINMDSIICGDYCYLYGGVADFKRETVTQLDAFDKVYAISERLGLSLHLIPWTFDNPAPGFDTPDYPSPSVGDWSDHISFAERGIEYVYIEASNWEIPGPDKQYDGDSETAEAGRIMHTDRDNLTDIESLFPGRALYHLQVFSLLIHTVLTEN